MGNDIKLNVRHRKGHNYRWLYITVAVVAIAVAGIWMLFFSGSSDEKGVQAEAPAAVETQVADDGDAGQEKQKQQESEDKASQVAASADDEAMFGEQTYRIHIHKLSHTLELYEKGVSEPIRTYGCAVAKNLGDKHRSGDNTTPTSWGGVEGSMVGAEPGTDSAKVPFRVEEICYAADWTHDFGDGMGEIAGAYGPWFISLNTGWNGIGIHGTHDPGSIGTNASEGCIRLHNENISELKKLISQNNGGYGVHVIISED
ncbi:MAG: L,D-transpeptidase [Anaerovibrio sp.]